jgi:hypothetical protein
MNKFLWNLFGIKDGDIPDEHDPSRRGFLRLLGGAAAVGVIQPTHFLAPAGGWPRVAVEWVPYRQPELISLSEYTRRAQLIVPALMDNVFQPSPVFTRIFKHNDGSRVLIA